MRLKVPIHSTSCVEMLPLHPTPNLSSGYDFPISSVHLFLLYLLLYYCISYIILISLSSAICSTCPYHRKRLIHSPFSFLHTAYSPLIFNLYLSFYSKCSARVIHLYCSCFHTSPDICRPAFYNHILEV